MDFNDTSLSSVVRHFFLCVLVANQKQPSESVAGDHFENYNAQQTNSYITDEE